MVNVFLFHGGISIWIDQATFYKMARRYGIFPTEATKKQIKDPTYCEILKVNSSCEKKINDVSRNGHLSLVALPELWECMV